jgi:GR25 family glycosyltransferase involved in LPS biosynthesis
MVTFCRNNETIQYERYQAIDGLTLDRDALIRDGVITPDNEFGAGALGAAMSHIGLWYRCLEENKVYHIAEDDAIIHPHAPKKIADLLSPIDDWDIVFWGWNFDFPMIVGYSSVVRPVTLMFDQEVLRQKSKLFPATCLIESTLVRLEHCTGLPFYSISPRGARMFLAHCLPIGANKLPPRGQRNFEVANKGLDIELGHHLPGAMAFACLPPLAITLNEHHTSTIWTDPPNS